MDRRKFIESSGRLGALAAIGLVIGLLAKNNKIETQPDPTHKCKGCKLNSKTCNLQPATCNPQPVTRNSQPVTRNPQPAIINHQSEFSNG